MIGDLGSSDLHVHRRLRYPTALLVASLLACSKPEPPPEPQVAHAVVKVVTTVPGMTPETLERAVAAPLEEALRRVPSLKKLRTWIHDDVVEIGVELEDEQTQAVRDAIGGALRILPQEAEVPIIERVWPSERQWLYVGDPSYRLDELRARYRIEVDRQPGVRRDDACGGEQLELGVRVDGDKLARYGLTLSAIAAALETARAAPAGYVERGGEELLVRVDARLDSAEDLGQLVVRVTDGAAVRLADVARVSVGPSRVRCLARFDGNAVVAFGVSADQPIEVTGLKRVGASRTVSLPIAAVGDAFLEQLAERVSTELHALVIIELEPTWNGLATPPQGAQVTVVAPTSVDGATIRRAFDMVPTAQKPPTLRVDIDREAAARFGVRVADIAETVRWVTGDVVAYTTDLTPIRLRLDSDSEQAFTLVRVQSESGALVPLTQLVKLVYE